MKLRIDIKLLMWSIGLICTSAMAHKGHGDELPWQACNQAQKNASCEYTNSHGDRYIGNCKLFNDALMCVRNKPIIRNSVPKEGDLEVVANKQPETIKTKSSSENN